MNVLVTFDFDHAFFPLYTDGTPLYTTAEHFSRLIDDDCKSILLISPTKNINLVKLFVRQIMMHFYSYPGACGQRGCAREQLECTDVCNRYAIHERFTGTDHTTEFSSNAMREGAALNRLASRLSVLMRHYFVEGFIVLQHTQVPFDGVHNNEIGPLNPNFFLEPVADPPLQVEPEGNIPEAPFAANQDAAQENPIFQPVLPGIVNYNLGPPVQLPYLGVGDRFVVDQPNAPADVPLHVDQPFFNPGFNAEVLDEGFLRDLLRL